MSSESFFLPTNKEEIVKRDAPITKLSFRRIQPQQTAVEDSFYGSTHSFKFSNSMPKHWIPSKSYCVLRSKIEVNYAGVWKAPTADIAPAFGYAHNLFQNVRVDVDGYQLTRSGNDYSLRASAFERIYLNDNYYEGLGTSNYADPSFANRKQDLLDNGNEFQAIFRPAIGLFFSEKIQLGAGEINLSFITKSKSQCEKSAVESDAELTFGDADTNVRLVITDFAFYACQMDGDADLESKIEREYVHTIEYPDINVRKITVGGGTSAHNVTVNKGTSGVAVALQSSAAGNSNLYIPTKFLAEDKEERKIDNLSINYGGQELLVPSENYSFKESANPFTKTNQLMEAYYRSIQHDESATCGGRPISFKKWLSMGPLFYYSIYKAVDNFSTSMDIRITRTGTATAPRQLIVFDAFKTVAQIRVRDSRVIDVYTEDI